MSETRHLMQQIQASIQQFQGGVYRPVLVLESRMAKLEQLTREQQLELNVRENTIDTLTAKVDEQREILRDIRAGDTSERKAQNNALIQQVDDLRAQLEFASIQREKDRQQIAHLQAEVARQAAIIRGADRAKARRTASSDINADLGGK